MNAHLERLAARAATIDELLSDAYEPLRGQKKDAALAARRLAAWCENAAGGDWLGFQRRLERDGLTFEQVLARFGTCVCARGAPPPSWLADAEWIQASLRATAPETVPQSVNSWPFVHLFVSLVDAGRVRLCERVGDAARSLAPNSMEDLADGLLGTVCSLTADAIYEQFVAFRPGGGADPSLPNSGPTDGAYRGFLGHMRSAGFTEMFGEKPVLLRLLCEVVRQWLDASSDLIRRICADVPLLREHKFIGEGSGRVMRVHGGLSDSHNGGYSVAVLVFEDGCKVVYKPKDLRADDAWEALVQRLNAAGAPYNLRAPRVLARQEYGWAEHVAHAGCEDREGIARYFRRAGAWLALFHCFAATDMHQENVIAAGEHPVPIDLEMVLQGAFPIESSVAPEDMAFTAAREMLDNSVGMVGLLPAYVRTPDKRPRVMGGLAGADEGGWIQSWSTPNTDHMKPIKCRLQDAATANLPHVEGVYAPVENYVGDFMEGFTKYAEFLASCKESADALLFAGFEDVPIRKVIRPTQFYYLLLRRLKDQRTMTDGAVWSAQLDFVARLANWEVKADVHWPLHRGERAALAKLNIPHFVTSAEGGETTDRIAGVSTIGAPSGLRRARRRIAELDASVILHETALIRLQLAAVAPALLRSEPRPLLLGAASDPGDAAAAIAHHLEKRAIKAGSSAAWIGMTWLEGEDVCQFSPLGYDLYNGTLGVAVFLAAYARFAGDSRFAELANAGVASLRGKLRSKNSARFGRAFGLGGAVGLGSAIYGLAVMSQLLEAPELLADAHRGAALLTEELIDDDRQLDVVGGSAGAALGLLRLYRDTTDSAVLRLAARCGDHLLSTPRVGRPGARSWAPSTGGAPLTGMAHGAAGYALALGSLAQVCDRADFEAAALECLTYESELYMAYAGDWPDLRPGERGGRSCQWCHGAPGIGLARLALLKRGTAEAWAPDVLRAVRRTCESGLSELDTLCCGSAGGTELLREAAALLGRADLGRLASDRLSEMLGRGAARGFTVGAGGEALNLGLFRGVAGVGYLCLRQLDTSLPNILSWE